MNEKVDHAAVLLHQCMDVPTPREACQNIWVAVKPDDELLDEAWFQVKLICIGAVLLNSPLASDVILLANHLTAARIRNGQ